jgi:midasin (ATPase involved in ribosome maturation)
VKNYQIDQYYADFCKEWESDLEKAMKGKRNSFMGSKEPMRDEDVSDESEMKLANSPSRKNEGGKEEKSKKISEVQKAEEKSSKNMNESGCVLAQKMKELEIMDVTDVEHVLDVEEALHYYSRLKSPVYLDIVDKFFTNMYTEFSVPKASASTNSS